MYVKLYLRIEVLLTAPMPYRITDNNRVGVGRTTDEQSTMQTALLFNIDGNKFECNVELGIILKKNLFLFFFSVKM